MKIIIIGGVAAGAKAAAKSKRLLPDSEIHIYTEDKYVAYSSCGLPFYIEGIFDDWHKLIIRTKEEFETSGIKIHTLNRVTKIIPNYKKIIVQNLENNESFEDNFDKLIIATGAKPFIPEIKNRNIAKVFTLRTLEDGINIRNAMQTSNHITIIGGGYISIELAEAFVKNGKQVSIIEKSPFILSSFDEDISTLVQTFILENSNNQIEILEDKSVIEISGEQRVNSILLSDNTEIKTDMVIIASGVTPNVQIAKDAGIIIGVTGAIKVNSRMQTNFQDIYACGDCAENTNIISHSPTWIPLGSTANKEGRIAAINACEGVEDFEGILGSAVLKYKNLTISITGFSEKEALKKGYDVVSAITTKRDKASYMPDSKYITLKVIADRRNHRILGAQAIGTGDADKRINTISAGILNHMTIEDLLEIDLTYAPPFSTSIDILITIARILKSKLS